LINYPLGIFLDEELIGAPNVQTVISNGSTIITGLSIDEAKTLKVQLNTGALPVEMREIQKQEIDATLGENTLVRTVQAGLIGILAVMFFMVVYYRVPGILASLALVTYISTVMMISSYFQTANNGLPHGRSCSGGMAVDANVLVFKRMKEESARAACLAIDTASIGRGRHS
jgi:protein-export membrane protein SecD